MTEQSYIEIDRAFFHEAAGLPAGLAATYSHGAIDVTIGPGEIHFGYPVELKVTDGAVVEVGFNGTGCGEFVASVMEHPDCPEMGIEELTESGRPICMPTTYGENGVRTPSAVLQSAAFFSVKHAGDAKFCLRLDHRYNGQCHISAGTITARLVEPVTTN